MASVVYVTTLAYGATNYQWARLACLLVSSSKTKLCQFSSDFSYVAVYALL